MTLTSIQYSVFCSWSPFIGTTAIVTVGVGLGICIIANSLHALRQARIVLLKSEGSRRALDSGGDS